MKITSVSNKSTCFSLFHEFSNYAIALFTVNFSHLHNNVFERRREAISENFGISARNCLTSTFKYIVMQTRKVNCEKGDWSNGAEKSKS